MVIYTMIIHPLSYCKGFYILTYHPSWRGVIGFHGYNTKILYFTNGIYDDINTFISIEIL